MFKQSASVYVPLSAVLFIVLLSSACLTDYVIQMPTASAGNSSASPHNTSDQAASSPSAFPYTFTAGKMINTPAPIGERSHADRPDDFPNMYQAHVIYALFKGQDDQKRDLDGSLSRSIQLAKDWFIKQSGGSTIRFDTYQGELDVTFVQFNTTKNDFLDSVRPEFKRQKETNPGLVIEDFYLTWIYNQLNDMGFSAPGKYYIVYLETAHPHSCGYSLHSNHLGVLFLQTTDCGYARLGVDKYAWNNEFIMLHEMLHGLGFVFSCAPHYVQNKPAHVNDSERDLMYPYAGRIESATLDVNHDDYFMHDNPDCPDLVNSAFLDPLPANPDPPNGWPASYLLPE